jgi:hypothetical protein
MSASEQLKALVSDYWEYEPPEGPEAPDVVIAALPQIVAVVEAAEDLAAWSDEQQAATGAEILASLALRIERDRAALTALEEALS